jgi:hypothetical protein
MQIHLKIAFLALTAMLTAPSVDAAQTAKCFDFKTLVKEPLREPIATLSPKDSTAAGKIEGKGVWGAARGRVNASIQDVYQRLLDHYTIKDPTRVKLRVYKRTRPNYMDFHMVMVELKPAPMITLDWEEDWGYFLADGTPEAPKKIVISYQKTDGTDYIPHLCGSIVLKAVTPGATDVSLYEEIEALGKRSGNDTAKGHLGTLATLRAPARAPASK